MLLGRKKSLKQGYEDSELIVICHFQAQKAVIQSSGTENLYRQGVGTISGSKNIF